MSKIYFILFIALFSIQSGRSNVIDYLSLSEEQVKREEPCENWDEGSEEKDKCLEDLCVGNERTFECRVLKCATRFPISGLTNHSKQDMSRLRCMKRVCFSNATQSVCQNLQKCESEKIGALGKAAYIICISKLFIK